MAITTNPSRQEVIIAYVDLDNADMANNTSYDVIELPANSVVVKSELIITETWNSSTSDVIDVGDASLATRYINDANLQAGGLINLTPTGFVTTATQNFIRVRWTFVGTRATTGKIRLQVAYFVLGRSGFTQG